MENRKYKIKKEYNIHTGKMKHVCPLKAPVCIGSNACMKCENNMITQRHLNIIGMWMQSVLCKEKQQVIFLLKGEIAF